MSFKKYLIIFCLLFLNTSYKSYSLENNLITSSNPIAAFFQSAKTVTAESFKELLTGTYNGLVFFGQVQAASEIFKIFKKADHLNDIDRFNICMQLIKLFLISYCYINKVLSISNHSTNNRPTLSINLNTSNYKNLFFRYLGFFLLATALSKKLKKVMDKFDNYNLDLFKKIRSLTYNKAIKNGIINLEEQCAICHENNNDHSVILLCDHQFHRECIMPWFYNQFECPLCKTRF